MGRHIFLKGLKLVQILATMRALFERLMCGCLILAYFQGKKGDLQFLPKQGITFFTVNSIINILIKLYSWTNDFKTIFK